MFCRTFFITTLYNRRDNARVYLIISTAVYLFFRGFGQTILGKAISFFRNTMKETGHRSELLSVRHKDRKAERVR